MEKSSTRNILLLGVVTYSMALAIGCLIHMPKVIEGAPQNSDKLLHGTAYFFFCLFWFVYLFLVGFKNYTFNKILFITIGWGLFFGMVIEILQSEFTTYRSGDLWDMLANSTGILLAVLLLYILKKRLNRIKTKF
ncbi:VanZ family protein [Flavimarina sp. Hel_I_48]|uniref:VanZ family protein n=1 Tax=Flavimarina sp. Hel_I_48 TaxID=1392488 RepID=UPI0006910073|nr:VanZ family protein [Flavimarina sp. Hel_I_48]